MTIDEATRQLDKLSDDLRRIQPPPDDPKYPSLNGDPVRAMSDLLNRMPRSQRQRFVAKMILEEHNTLQQNFMRDIIVPCIEGFAALHAKGYYDLRNEGTCRLATEIVEKVPERGGLPFV